MMFYVEKTASSVVRTDTNEEARRLLGSSAILAPKKIRKGIEKPRQLLNFLQCGRLNYVGDQGGATWTEAGAFSCLSARSFLLPLHYKRQDNTDQGHSNPSTGAHSPV